MKAYQVDSGDDEESGSVIVFASSSVVARREGGNELGLDFDEVDSCCRAPNFDKYYPGPIHVKVYIAEGWSWGCSRCDTRIDEYFERPPYYHSSHSVYCSVWCRHLEVENVANRRRILAENRRICEKRWPGIKFMAMPPYCDKKLVEFTFPGSGTRRAQYRMGSKTIIIDRMDQEAWRDFNVSRLRMKESLAI